MPRIPQPLYQFGTITLNGSGGGTAFIGPTRVREHWQLASASVAVATSVQNATCNLYIGSFINNQTFVSQTVTGSSGDTCGLGGTDIQTGMKIWAVWTGGDAGQLATVTVIGTYTIGAPS
jgi:hypothetical protein